MGCGLAVEFGDQFNFPAGCDQESKHPLSNVLIKVKARFDPQYGFSVNIEDIDSSFTLGDIAKRYQQILLRLTEEGLLNNNKQLPVPFDIQNVLVIAPENAAGLGDFKKEDKTVIQINGLKNYKYINDKGKTIDVIKGISKNSVKRIDPETKEIVFETPKYLKTKQSLRNNKEAGQAFVMQKRLKHKYDKREVFNDGQTKPIKL